MKQLLCGILLICSYYVLQAQSIELQMPIDGSAYIPLNPVFNWTVLPTPINNIRNVFTIAPYIANQSNQTTINTNAIYTDEIISSNSFITYLYPAASLSSCTSYIWQVKTYTISYTTTEPIQPVYTFQTQSPIYSFTTTGCSNSSPEQENSTTPVFYIVPERETDNFVHLLPNKILGIKYHEAYTASAVHYKIYTTSLNVLADSTFAVQKGMNYLTLNLTGLNLQASPQIYILELQTSKDELLKSKFEIKTQ